MASPPELQDPGQTAPWLCINAIAVAGMIHGCHAEAFGQIGAKNCGALIAPLAADTPPRQLAQALFVSPLVVLAHDGSPLDQGEGPRLIYANRAALNLWQRPWNQMVGLPSRLTAAPAERSSRQTALISAQQQQALTGYGGIRIDSSGRRFQINNARLWSLGDGTDGTCGQAACFSSWWWI